MTKISDLSDELLVKILSFLPTKVAVSTSVLSKQWEFLWMWLPNLEFNCVKESVRDFINKNLPLHRAPIINSLRLTYCNESLQAETFKSWLEIAVSRCVRELSIRNVYGESLFLPNSLYTCNSLVSLELHGSWNNPVDVTRTPRTVCLPSLKTLKLHHVTYSNEDSLRLLLSYCPVLEDLIIDRVDGDNVSEMVIIIRSLQRLSLFIGEHCNSDVCVIVTPSLKYFLIQDKGSNVSYLVEHMPRLEEADISLDNDKNIEKILKSITTVKCLTICIPCNSRNETVYGDDIVFNHLKKLKVCICIENWSKLLFQLLKDSPILQILDLGLEYDHYFLEHKPICWSNKQSSVPKCLLKSLKTFTFEGPTRKDEERDVLSYIFKHARSLNSASIFNLTMI